MIANYDPVLQALLASLFTWGVTALGASLCFILPANSKKFLDVSLGFAAGVMTAASFWSLLAPAIEIAETSVGSWAFVPVAIGFALGALFVHLSDKLIPSCVVAEMSIISALTEHEPEGTEKKAASSAKTVLPKGHSSTERYFSARDDGLRQRIGTSRMLEGGGGSASVELNTLDVEDEADRDKPSMDSDTVSSTKNSELALSWRRILLLIMAVTVHNIPEGLAVGVGFGSIGKTPAATFEKAFNLAVGIGLQNFPEGLAVSLPLTGFGYSKLRAFTYGQMSGIVEPFAAVIGAAAVLLMEPVLPYALSFAAGAMIYVVFDDIVPESNRNGNGKLASAGAIVGFLVMMCMDVGLG
ncbi:Protein F59A3.4 [Aphelenchoides avenae]|nr:Protein F59A3.4 [Aphelenchus avenae]